VREPAQLHASTYSAPCNRDRRHEAFSSALLQYIRIAKKDRLCTSTSITALVAALSHAYPCFNRQAARQAGRHTASTLERQSTALIPDRTRADRGGSRGSAHHAHATF